MWQTQRDQLQEMLANTTTPTSGGAAASALDHVGFVEKPAWMDDDMLVSVAASLSPWLSDDIGILDEPTALRLRAGLVSTPWVERARLERVFPDRFRLRMERRGPARSGQAADDQPVGGGDERASAPTWRKDGHCDHARAQAREEGDDEAQARFEHEQRAVARAHGLGLVGRGARRQRGGRSMSTCFLRTYTTH